MNIILPNNRTFVCYNIKSFKMTKKEKANKDSNLWLWWVVTKSIARKYSFDIVLLLICVIVVYILKCTDYRFPLLINWDYKIVNETLDFVCSTYSITFITLLVNSIFKEWKKYKNLFPHIKTILRRTLGVYSSRISWLESKYEIATGKKTFSFEDKDFNIILDYCNQRPEDIKSFCRFNNCTAIQIYYDMEAILRFSDCLDSELISTVHYISTNLFILQNKGEEHKDLSSYSIMFDDERRLKEHYIKLKEYSIKIFGDKILPRYMKY